VNSVIEPSGFMKCWETIEVVSEGQVATRHFPDMFMIN
jgi:hypothetical protein